MKTDRRTMHADYRPGASMSLDAAAPAAPFAGRPPRRAHDAPLNAYNIAAD